MLATQLINAQNYEDCILVDYDPNNFIVSSVEKANASQNLPVVFNVAFWQINDPSGNYPEPITEYKVLTVIAEMNKMFNQYGIFLKYRGLNEFDSPNNVVSKQWLDLDGDGLSECETLPSIDPDGYMRLSRCQISDMRNYAYANGHRIDNSFNIYIPYETQSYGGSSNGYDFLTFHRNGVSGKGMIHEFAHSFGLHHTHGAGQDNFTWRHPTNPDACEHVTRDVANSEFNALNKGDDEYDTAAAPNYVVEYCHFNGLTDNECYGTNLSLYYVDEDSCSYDSSNNNTDCAGTDYDIYDSDVRNYMAYTRNSCRDSFTPDQIAKMQGRVTSGMDNLKTDIESLYEPYKGEYYLGGPLVDGVNYTPLFQPGFDYWFIECSGSYPEPAAYNENFYFNLQNKISHYTKDEEDYGAITHPNHTAIKIGQVETTLGRTNIQKCYNNFNLSPSSGTLFTFNDGVLNTNVTIQPLDSLGINNPQLIDNLNPGLYNIEKIYEGNATQESIILKDNN